jgi:hypothetical protein
MPEQTPIFRASDDNEQHERKVAEAMEFKRAWCIFVAGIKRLHKMFGSMI